ncbi:MAG: hypothetical protein L6300_09110, partial [Syntrophaceae bacterium]|nr:hypothetical protein [Syntrophaceae bacterium]
ESLFHISRSQVGKVVYHPFLLSVQSSRFARRAGFSGRSGNSNLMPPFVDIGFSIVCLHAIKSFRFQ